MVADVMKRQKNQDLNPKKAAFVDSKSNFCGEKSRFRNVSKLFQMR
jgi:hypothetical protein